MYKLKEIVNNSNKSITEIAKEVGIPRATFYRYMNEERDLKGQEIIKICRYFCITSDYLLNIDEKA